MDNKTELIGIALIVVFSIALGAVVTLFMFKFGFIKQESTSVFSTNNLEDSDCDGGIIQTATCLNLKLQTFYKYNLSNAGKLIDFETLKREGGVCQHYAEWYLSQIKNSSIFKQTIFININLTAWHEVALISNQEGYCVLDQEEIGCVKFGRQNES